MFLHSQTATAEADLVSGIRGKKNASLKCLISYNYLIIPGEPRMPLNSSPFPPLLAQCERVSNFPPSSSVKTHSFGGKVS